jgi:hypothetical protein
MNVNERAPARKMFQNLILSSDGSAYERLFTAVMQHANKDFRQVKPQGRLGDRKNDGYDSTTGRYYQVYAPESLQRMPGKADVKLAADFAGLKAYWDPISPIREYYFVMNDRYQGTLPTVESDLAKLKSAHALNVCETYLAKDLEDELFKLPDDVISDIVGFGPDPAQIEQIDYSVLAEVIAHVMRHSTAVTAEQVLKVPDFSRKIIFNNLCTAERFLTLGSYQTGLVEDYFANNSAVSKQDVRNKMNELFQEAEIQHADTVGQDCSGDPVFWSIVNTANPKAASKAAQDATIVLMAHFFESCDIFLDSPDGE